MASEKHLSSVASGAAGRASEPDPVIEAYKRDSDRSLLRENLKLTLEQRRMKLCRLQRFAAELQGAGRGAADHLP